MLFLFVENLSSVNVIQSGSKLDIMHTLAKSNKWIEIKGLVSSNTLNPTGYFVKSWGN